MPLCAVSMNTSHCNVQRSVERAPAPAPFGHAGGMKAISLRLSAATPQEPHANRNASQRDASIHRERFLALGALAGIPSGCALIGGVFRSCRCAKPPACINRCDAPGIRFVTLNNLGHQRLPQCPSLRASFHPSLFTAQRDNFLLPTENSESLKKDANNLSIFTYC